MQIFIEASEVILTTHLVHPLNYSMDLVLFAFVYDMSHKTLAKFKSFKYPKEDLHLLKKIRKMPTEADKVGQEEVLCLIMCRFLSDVFLDKLIQFSVIII